MAAPSWQQYFDTGKAEAIIRRPDLSFLAADITEMMMSAGAAMADFLTGYAARRFNATYLDGAKGDDLTTLASDHWGIERQPPTAATGTVTFSRTGTAPGTVPAGTVISTEKDIFGNSVDYSTDIDVSWTTGDVANKSVPVTAVYPGPNGSVDVGKVTRITSTVFDDSLTVTNAARMAGGDDEESDDDLRGRVRALPKALRRATLDAIEYGALQIPEVKRATAKDRLAADGVTKTGIVDLYIADVNGGFSSTMITDVTTELVNWVAGGVIVNVFGGTLRLQAVDVSLDVRAGIDTRALVPKVQAAIIARVTRLKIGEKLQPEMISQAVYNTDSNIIGVTVNNPATTVVPDADELIRVDGSPSVH